MHAGRGRALHVLLSLALTALESVPCGSCSSRRRDVETPPGKRMCTCTPACCGAGAINIWTLDVWARNPLRKCGHAASMGGGGGTFCTGHGVEGQEVQASKVKRSKSKYTCGRCPRDVSRSLLCAVLHCSTGTCEQNMMSHCVVSHVNL